MLDETCNVLEIAIKHGDRETVKAAITIIHREVASRGLSIDSEKNLLH